MPGCFARLWLLLALWGTAGGPAHAAVAAPVLKWAGAAAFGSWAETGWYAAPAVVNAPGTGTLVISATYAVHALRGETGALLWRAVTGHAAGEVGAINVGRTWPSVSVADLNQDGVAEIITAHGGGCVAAYDLAGRFMPGFPWFAPGGNELRSLAVANLDATGPPEIIVGRAAGSAQNTWVLDATGHVRAGWPQITAPTPGYAWGVYDNNLAVGNLAGDARLEVVVPSDVHYIAAYDAAGAPLPANALYGAARGVWGRVGVFHAFADELLGYAAVIVPGIMRPNFATSPAVMADVDGDGTREVVVIGNNYDFSGAYVSLNQGPYLFNADRTRYDADGNDWHAAPTPGGLPLSEDYNVIEAVSPAPAVADLDGDGRREIIYPSYDGKLHAVWLDKTEHGAWPLTLPMPAGASIVFATEPVVADLDRDGRMEVLCATWPDKASNAIGDLLVLGWDGQLLHRVVLPVALGPIRKWNGVLATPTLANLDADADWELVVQTVQSGVAAYDLPGSAGAPTAWPTARGGFARTGQPPPAADAAARSWAVWE